MNTKCMLNTYRIKLDLILKHCNFLSTSSDVIFLKLYARDLIS